MITGLGIVTAGAANAGGYGCDGTQVYSQDFTREGA
jgi:hypothetical protein